jgi:hypothetical protein
MTEQSDKNALEKKLFESLNLTQAERQYISVEDDDTVRIGFPISIGGIYVGSEEVALDEKDEIDLYDKVVEFYTDKMSEGGFKDVHLFTVPSRCRKHVDFYKEFNSEEEAKEAIKWLLEFKKRTGI